MTQGTLERGGRNVQLLQNYTCYKSTSHKFSKTSEASLNEIAQVTNQEKKITGLLESLRRNELNCHVVPVLQKNVRLL